MAFDGYEFIRVGSVKQKLRGHPEKERILWQTFDRISFEYGIAETYVDGETVMHKLNYPTYFHLLDLPLPDGRAAILDALLQDELINRSEATGWDITNLGAILFARELRTFPSIRRKAVRIVRYSGRGRTDTLREIEIFAGYATEFQRIVDHIMTLVSSNETIEKSLRKTEPAFPEIAVRELVSNALIHQDFSISGSGAGPMVEIFDDRMEITNPGKPLVDTDRFVDTPPKSRNESLASMMRRFRICEERGSGIDKVVRAVETSRLPAPLFESPGEFTKVVLFSRKPMSAMNKTERVRACYMHACLRYVMNEPMNNASVRERFGISQKNSARASKLLKEAVESDFVFIRDPESGYRSRTYLPFWAGSPNGVHYA